MRRIEIRRGLDIPISGKPDSSITDAGPLEHVALIGDDYVGMKPTMLVAEGERVSRGQPLFSDKKNEGVVFTAPAAGTVTAINRGAKRKFESLVIRIEGDEALSFCPPATEPDQLAAAELRKLLVDSGMWCAFRTRPYGKVPKIDGEPASLFVTAIDTSPLAPDMKEIIGRQKDDFLRGLKTLANLVEAPIYLCRAEDLGDLGEIDTRVEQIIFHGPHPAGLPSTHIHFLDPVHEHKTVWHISAQDVSAIGGLLRTGQLCSGRIIALAGPSVGNPRLINTVIGCSISEICADELVQGANARLLSGSVLDGRQAGTVHDFLGRYHQQISCLPEGDGRQLFGWLRPGGERFSTTRAFWSTFSKPQAFEFNTAIWGGDRAIFPLGTYEKVMPLDIIATYFLKSLASGNSERAKELGCLELIEEDLALCSYVCPGKNEFGPMLRRTLTTIEEEG